MGGILWALPGEGFDPGWGSLVDVDSKERLGREFAAYFADIVPKDEFLAVYKAIVTDFGSEQGQTVATEARDIVIIFLLQRSDTPRLASQEFLEFFLSLEMPVQLAELPRDGDVLFARGVRR